MGYFGQRAQWIIWLMVLVPVIVFWIPDDYYKPGLDVLMISVISISIGVVLMVFGSFKRIQELKKMQYEELQKLNQKLQSETATENEKSE